MTSKWMIYGATGYTGELIARAAAADGHKPILAGRRRDAVEALAEELGLDGLVFALDDRAAMLEALADVSAVLHCAGPFIDTSSVMVSACLESKTHYLDITGEIGVFEACQRKSERAQEAGIVLLPGVGFDVVPTDCLAAQLAEALPGADLLELAFAAGAGPSRGTAKTAIRGLGEGGAVRRDGRITKVPMAWKSKTIEFADKSRTAVTIPWGDVSTAFYSTGISNIEVYMAMSPKAIKRMRWLRPLRPLLASEWLQRFLTKRVDSRARGPSESEREERVSQVWGRVSKDGTSVSATLTTMESYKLTVATALEAAVRVARGDVAPGTKTPSQAFGSDFIEKFERTHIRVDS